MSFRGSRKLLQLSSCLVEFDINLSASCGCSKIRGLKYKCMSKNSFPKKDRFLKSLLTSKLIFSKLCKAKVKKMTHIILWVFMRKRTSQIWVFLAFRPCRKRPPVRDKIQKYLLSRYYHVCSNKLYTPLQERNNIYIYFFFNLLSIIFTFAFTQT